MKHIGRYRLVSRLGAGAFATVWLAQDEELDVQVAIKVLADNWSSNADIRERFLAEARLLRRIADPRVVRVHDIGVVDEQPYFVMDYVPGGTLQDLVSTRPSPAEAIHLGAESAFAVQVLHDHDVVHRDIKPSNLLLSLPPGKPPTVLVTDLGMAKSLAEASGLTVTAGTPAYMAPEQVQGSEGFDARADVYAVAAVTFSLLAGRPPFTVQSLTDVMTRDRSTPPPPAALAAGLPAAVDNLLASALSFDSGLRPSSAREFGDQLVSAAQQPHRSGEPDGSRTEFIATVRGVHPTELRELPATGAAAGASEVGEPEARTWSTAAVVAAAVLSFLLFGAGTWAALHLLP